jgi:hypothetical protein
LLCNLRLHIKCGTLGEHGLVGPHEAVARGSLFNSRRIFTLKNPLKIKLYVNTNLLHKCVLESMTLFAGQTHLPTVASHVNCALVSQFTGGTLVLEQGAEPRPTIERNFFITFQNTGSDNVFPHSVLHNDSLWVIM